MNNFKKKIEKLGMKTEFEGWIKDKKNPFVWERGAKVRVLPSGDNRYHITKGGSEGYIYDVLERNEYFIKFYKLTGYPSKDTLFEIEKEHLELIR